MHEGSNKIPKRKSQDRPDKPNESERAQLIEDIRRMEQNLYSMDKRIIEHRHKQQKMLQSNQRNEKRLLRYRARIEEMIRYKDSPEHLLSISGYMNESIQEYILSHNYTFSTNPNEVPDPDNMTYQQLIDLGEKIGKVSKGLHKQEIQKLVHKKNKKQDQRCPICQSEFQLNETIIQLRCRHCYHEECIGYWLKDENTCPMCKQSLLDRPQMKQEQKFEF